MLHNDVQLVEAREHTSIYKHFNFNKHLNLNEVIDNAWVSGRWV